jgi:Asp-tRNA(Asn)/Glu-tRNA(Gln) amidotransferase A subunit family amidase
MKSPSAIPPLRFAIRRVHTALIARCLGGLLMTCVLGGCSVSHWFIGKHSDDHAFIYYWPPPEGSTGLRLAVKDNIDVKGVVTTAGSEYLLKNGQPAKRDAKCLAIARQRGVRIVGKANLSEFAVSPSGINVHFGTPSNPFNGWSKLIPGGSSSGSAAAVALGLADVALGTDTAGSVRVPAAFCGVVGLKTTHGLVSLDGIYPIEAEHLDTVGPIARNIEDTVKGMDLLQEGFAARYREAKAAKPAGESIKVGRLRVPGTNRRVEEAVDAALARAGFQVVELDEAFQEKWEQAKKDGNDVAAAGAWISDQDYRNKLGVSGRTKAAILVGRINYLTSYQPALARRAAWQRELRRVFKKVDFIVLPTLKMLPPKIPPDLKIGIVEALMLTEQNTVAVNFAGNPALAVPIPVEHASVPVTSLQLIGPMRSEAALLNAGRIIEEKQAPARR